MATPIHALRAQHLPTVLSKTEVSRLLSEMRGKHQWMAGMLEAG